MEQQPLNYGEWFFQSDYDLETAQQMLLSGRNIYEQTKTIQQWLKTQ